VSDPVFAAALLGFVLGVQHATDPDHLVAVATIVTRERRFVDGALVGVLWGIGHMLTLGVAGAVIVALGLAPAPAFATVLELLVAAMLVLLGVLRLRDAARGLETVPPAHLKADHEHGGAEVVHSHAHEHGVAVHLHPHVHPSRRLLGAWRDGRLPTRALFVGAVHGMAGSAAVSLLVLATLRSVWGATLYLGVFGLGTILGMTALTAALAFPVSLALRLRRARRLLAFGAGVASIAFGVVYAIRVF
jgi:ABC-type nickel/cobalt efflux system permease component RcnA